MYYMVLPDGIYFSSYKEAVNYVNSCNGYNGYNGYIYINPYNGNEIQMNSKKQNLSNCPIDVNVNVTINGKEYEDIKNGTYRKQKIDIEKDAVFNENEFIDEIGMFTNESNNSTNALTDFHQQNTQSDKPIMTKYYDK